jgi:hypothetical protein
MKYARFDNNLVLEVFTPPEGFTLSECFHPAIAVQFISVPDEVEANWKRNDDGTFTAPVTPDQILIAP